MSFANVSPDEEAQITDSLYTDEPAAPSRPGIVGSDVFTQPFKGLARAALKADQGLNDVIAPVYSGIDELLGKNDQQENNDRQAAVGKYLQDKVDELAPNPATSSYAGEVLNGLFDVGAQAAAGFTLGGPLGAATATGAIQGYATFKKGESEGLDPETAAGQGALEGGFAAAGTVLPFSLGARGLTSALLYGPAINLAQGAASRGLIGGWLRERGYTDAADQYKALDGQSMAIDAILGAAFGYLGAHESEPINLTRDAMIRDVQPSDVDAALVANEAQHVELDSAPGIPVDLSSRQQHYDAMTAAIAQKLRGAPVTVDGALDGATFAPKPHEAQMLGAIRSALDKAGYGDVLRQVDQTVAEAKAANVPLPQDEELPRILPESEALPEAPATSATAQATPAAPVDTIPGLAADVREVPVESIGTAPEALQYKINYGAEGAGLALTKAQRFNRELGGVVTLMTDPENPDRYLVVNGHQRLDLARRSGEASMRAQILPPETSFEQARAIGARINIAEERGTAVDAAKFMRDTGTTPEQLASEGIDQTAATSRDAAALRNLSDQIFRDVTTGRTRPSRGVTIGRELGENRPAQDAIFQTIRDLEERGQPVSDAKLAEMIRIAKGSENVAETQTDLFGTQTLEKNLAPQQADILAYVREQLSRDKRLFGAAARGKARLEQGGSTIDEANANAISQGSAIRMAALDATAYSRGTATNGLVRSFARDLADAPRGERGSVLQKAYGEIYGALERDYGSQIATENGDHENAANAYDRAQGDIQQANEDSRAFQAAVDCFNGRV